MTPMSLSDRLLADIAFGAMIGQRFVADIAADRLPSAVFDRYLVHEGAFVETAIRIFAYATAKTPGIAAQRPLVAVLDALANTRSPTSRPPAPPAASTPPPTISPIPPSPPSATTCSPLPATAPTSTLSPRCSPSGCTGAGVDAAGPNLDEVDKSQLCSLFGRVSSWRPPSTKRPTAEARPCAYFSGMRRTCPG